MYGMDILLKAVHVPAIRNVTGIRGQIVPCIIQSRCFAARRGTRAKADKKKKSQKVEVKNIAFIPHGLREKGTKGPKISRRYNDSHKPPPSDDVWIARFHRFHVFSFKEAVEGHRETHHPQIYNLMNSYIRAVIELDMRTKKKTKFVDTFTRVAPVDHQFDLGESRTLLVFCKTEDLKQQAEANGATLVGDGSLAKKVEKGEMVLPDFNFVLAHPNVLPEMVSLRGLLKKKFPNPKFGNLSVDVGAMVRRFKHGIEYTAVRDDNELDYGCIDTPIGTLNMETEHLEKNLKNLLEDIMMMKPSRDGPFITRVFITSPPSSERFVIDANSYLPQDSQKDSYDSDSDDERQVKTS